MKTFKVEFNEYWSYDKSYSSINFLTLAAKDGEEAVAKAKTHVLKQFFKDDKKPTLVHKVIRFELLGLELLDNLDI